MNTDTEDSVIVLGSSSESDAVDSAVDEVSIMSSPASAGAPGGQDLVDLCSPDGSSEGRHAGGRQAGGPFSPYASIRITQEALMLEVQRTRSPSTATPRRERYESYTERTEPLNPTVLQAVRAAQPPLPASAVDALPLPSHRDPGSLGLTCTQHPGDLQLVPEGRVSLPPDAATAAAFSGHEPILLGHFDLPLSPPADDSRGERAAAAAAAELAVVAEEMAREPGLPSCRLVAKRLDRCGLAVSLKAASSSAGPGSLIGALLERRGQTAEADAGGSSSAAAASLLELRLAELRPPGKSPRGSLISLLGQMPPRSVRLAFELLRNGEPAGLELLHEGFAAAPADAAGASAGHRGAAADERPQGAGDWERRIAETGAEPMAWGARMHVYLGPEFAQTLLAEEGELAREAGLEWPVRLGGKRPKPTRSQQAAAWGLAELLQHLLAFGSGLWLGPDCDGLLNFCDAKPAAALLTEVERAEVERCMAAPAGGEPGALSCERGLRLPDCTSLPSALFSIQNVLVAGAIPADYPEAPAPLALRGLPKHFQLQGLEWMLRRERVGEATERSTVRLYPTWRQFVTAAGLVFYLFRPAERKFCPQISLGFLPAPSSGTCGGFLCDEMGLGKTLESLMLVLSNPAPPGWAVGISHIAARLLALRKQQQQQQIRQGEAAPAPEPEGAAGGSPLHTNLDLDGPIPIKTTIVVVPNNLMEQWQQEIRIHVRDGALKCGEYDSLASAVDASDLLPKAEASAAPSGSNGNGNAMGRGTRSSRRHAAKVNATTIPEVKIPMCKTIGPGSGAGQRVPLPELDLVFLSYEQMRKELSGGTGTVRNSPLLRFGFWRIVLDEAQLVADSNSVAAVMASHLWRRHAWVVTGTPISSHMKEIRGLCEFLALDPFSGQQAWQSMVNNQYQSRTLGGLLGMRGLLHGVMLRRTQEEVKEQLQLPPCARVDLPVQLNQVERICYNQILSKYRQAVRALKLQAERDAAADRSAGRLLDRNTRRSVKLAPRVMAGLTALRQSCCHPHIVAASATASDDPKSGKRKTMREIMRRLVTKACADLDEAVAAWLRLRLLAAAAKDAAEGRDDGAAVLVVLKEVRENVAFAFSTDLKAQARARGCDGAILAPQLGAAPEDPAADVAAEDAVKEREARDLQQRRYKRLELECMVLQAFCISRRWPGILLEDGAAEKPDASTPSKASPDALGTKARRTSEGKASGTPGPSKGPGPAPAEVRARLQELMEGEVAIREELGLPAVSFLAAVAAGEVRRSKRVGERNDKEAAEAAAMDEDDSDFDMDIAEDEREGRKRARPTTELSHEEMLHRSELCVRNLLDVLQKKDPVNKAQKAVLAGKAEMERLWHSLQHLINEEEEQAKQRKEGEAEKGAAQAGTADEGDNEEPQDPVCPICLDVPESKTMTSCGHSFCRDCIRECVSMAGSMGAKCPICRTQLRSGDLFESKTDAEKQEEVRLQELQRIMAAANGDYGSKVTALLSELAAIEEADPGAKSLVFSTWGRLLKLVGHALAANGIVYVTMAGSGPDARREALHRFASDPSCRVLLLLMSKSSGAAGLTLTHANHAFLMEPAISPGLEAQAAARISRLGQQKPTRVVRFIAQDTVEERVLQMHHDLVTRAGHRRLLRTAAEAGAAAGNSEAAAADLNDEPLDNQNPDVDRGTLLRFFDM